MATFIGQFAGLLVDVSIKAAILAGVAGAALAVLRVRSSNVRHRVWTAVLVGIVLLPLLVALAPSVPLPGWMVPAWQGPGGAVAVVSGGGQSHFAPRTAQNWDSPQTPAKPQAAGRRELADNGVSRASAEASPATPSTPPWPAVLVATYLIGAAVFVGRLVVAVMRARALARGGRAISLPPGHALLVGTTVLESAAARVPLTVGWRRPVILLPSDWTNWSASMLSAVLRHERAHIARGDHWVTLVAEWNRAMYWFHPVAWLVRRRLAALAEEACDDAVIQSLGDRTGYARHLLEVARRLAHEPRRLKPASVAMARTPQVERRINAILDARRPLARRLGVAGVLALVAIAVPLVLVAAGLKAGDNSQATPNPSAAAPPSEAKTASEAGVGSQAASQAPVTAVSGQIVDAQSRPVAGAHLRLFVAKRPPLTRGSPAHSWWCVDNYWTMVRSIGELLPADDVLEVLSTTTGPDGRFQFTEVRPGPYVEVAYWGDGLAPGRVEDVQKLSETQRLNLAITAVAAGVVRGTIDRQSLPEISNMSLTGPKLRFGPEDATCLVFYWLDVASQDSYQFRDVPPGSYWLIAYGKGKRTGPGSHTNPLVQQVEVEVRSGETTDANIVRRGRPVVGRLVMPRGLAPEFDWTRAFVSMRAAPKEDITWPKIPYPKDINPRTDRQAAAAWVKKWLTTGAGKHYQEEAARYSDAMQKYLSSAHYGADVKSDGSFRFADVLAGRYELTASAPQPGARGAILPSQLIASLKYKFTVPEMPGGSSAEPLDLGELTLQAGGKALGAGAEAKTASDGAGEATAPTGAAGEAKTASDGSAASRGEAAKGKEGRTLELTVLDDDGHPVAGASVTERIRQVYMGPWKVTRMRADAAGRVKLDVPAETPYYLSASIEAPGYAPFFAEWEPRDDADAIPAAYAVHLDRGRLVGGVVENEEGEPIRGAKVSPEFQVRMRPERTYQSYAGVELTTDAKGQWTYASLPADLSQLNLALRHADYLAERIAEPVSKFAIPPGGSPIGVIVMKRGLPIAGRATDDGGRPLAGATVTYFCREGYASGEEPKARTDNDGRYRIVNGRAGLTFFTASAEGWAPAIRNVRVEAGMGPVDFQLARGKPMSVRVIDPQGAPIQGADVALWNWEENEVTGQISGGRGETDAEGVWRWPHAPAGSLEFLISKPGFATVRDRKIAAGEEAEVTLTPERPQVLTVSGRVTDAETQEPIARFRVGVGEQRREGATVRWYADQQSDGRDGQFRREFTRYDLSSDRYACVLKIEADGYRPATSRPITEREGTVTVDFQLQPAAGAQWQVLTPDGQPARSAMVAVATPDLGPTIRRGVLLTDATCDRTSTDAAGRFSIAPPQGTFALVIVHASGAAIVTQDQLARGQPIRLQPWGRVEGVLRIDGKPAGNEQISLQRGEPPEQGVPEVWYDYYASTDKDGRFAFEQVMPGKVQVVRTVEVKEPHEMTAEIPTHVATAEVAPGQTAHVDLSRRGRPVVAKLVMPTEAVTRYGTVDVKTKLPEEVTTGYDWRLAMVSLRTAPKDMPTLPTVPFPKNIDPQQDRAAALQWYQEWLTTEEGKRYQEQVKRYSEAVRGFRSVDLGSTNVEPDGSLRFVDIPAGGYQLTVSAQAPPAEGKFVPGRVIASLTYTFTVPEMPGGSSEEPLDLGQLVLKAVPRAGR